MRHTHLWICSFSYCLRYYGNGPGSCCWFRTLLTVLILIYISGPSWSWSSGSLIYNYKMYLCNQCLSPLTLWVQISLGRCILDTTLCDKVCKWLAAGPWFYLCTPVSSTNKTDRHDITEILLKVALNTITTTIISISYNNCVNIFLLADGIKI